MWEYRVLRIIGKKCIFEIREVYINFEKKIQYITKSKIQLNGNSIKDLAIIYAKAELAFQKPIITLFKDTNILMIGNKNVGYAQEKN